MLSSVALLYPDTRHFDGQIDPSINEINVISNGVKIGHIVANWDKSNWKSSKGSEINFKLVIDQTQDDMTKDLTLHIRQGKAIRINPWQADWLFLKGTTPNNPAHVEIVTSDNTYYKYELYNDPSKEAKPWHSKDNNGIGIDLSQELGDGLVWLGHYDHDTNTSFTKSDYILNKVFKISRQTEIDGVSIPNFKSLGSLGLGVNVYNPILDENGIYASQYAHAYRKDATRLADGLSAQQVADAAKDSHLVYSVSDDGQSILFGINTPIDRESLNQLTGDKYSVDDAINAMKNGASDSRALMIDHPEQTDHIVSQSVNWIKVHNGEPYDMQFNIRGLPYDSNQPNIQTLTDVTPGITDPHSSTDHLFPKNSDLYFDASVYRNLNIKYIDDDNHGNIINTDTFQTSTGTNLTYNIKKHDDPTFNSATDIAFPDNYILAPSQATTVHYGVIQDKNRDIEIHVKHLIKSVDGSNVSDIYPNIKKALNGDSTRTFHITYPTGRQGNNPSTIIQSIHFTRTGTADFSTDTVVESTLGKWNPVASTAKGVTITNGVANFDPITLPRIAGYKAYVVSDANNPSIMMVSFIADTAPTTLAFSSDSNDTKQKNNSTSNNNVDNQKNNDISVDKPVIPSTPSIINTNDNRENNKDEHGWTINSIKSSDYVVSNGINNYTLPMIGNTGLSIIKTSDNTLAFTYIRLNTPSDYVFTLTKRHKLYQLKVGKVVNGKLTTIKTFKSHNYEDLMKELKKMYL